MSDWIVIVADSQQAMYSAKVFGPFRTEEIAKAAAAGFMSGSLAGTGTGKWAQAVRMETP